MHSMLESFVNRHPETKAVIENIRGGQKVEGFTANSMAQLRQEWLVCLHAAPSETPKGPDADVLAAWGGET